MKATKKYEKISEKYNLSEFFLPSIVENWSNEHVRGASEKYTTKSD
jgi:hypothetical protein